MLRSVLDLEAHVARERLRTLPDEQVVIGVLHALPCATSEGVSHALQRRHAARLLPRPVHAAGIELHDPVRVRQPP